jgi:hypothetical protein
MRTIVAISAVAAALVTAAPALATGQPNASCEATGATPPPGFATAGFANAQGVYAGTPGTPSAANGSADAVSQYDIACFGGPGR